MVVAVSGYIVTKGEVKSVRSLSWGETKVARIQRTTHILNTRTRLSSGLPLISARNNPPFFISVD